MGHSRPPFLYFCLLNTIADDWIRTVDFWYQRRPPLPDVQSCAAKWAHLSSVNINLLTIVTGLTETYAQRCLVEIKKIYLFYHYNGLVHR